MKKERAIAHSLRTWALATIAALGVGLIFSSTTQAEGAKGIFTANSTPPIYEDATIIGTQENEPVSGTEHDFFAHTPEGSRISCDLATYEGTLDEGQGTSLAMTPEYKHCFGAGGRPATVSMNGCRYIFTQPTTIDEGKEYTGKADLTCPEEKVIEITIFLFGNATNTTDSTPVCKIEVIPNGEVTGEGEEAHRVDELDGHVVYENGVDEGTGKDVVAATATVEGITTYMEGGGCPEQGHHNNGVLNSAATVYALEDDGTLPHEDHLDTWIGHHPEQP